MGIKHLRQIENLLKTNKREFSMAEIRNELGMNYNSFNEVIAYLLSENKIERIKEKYRWKDELPKL